ncbi:MAG: PEP-CTERM sorting domain-containing protein [Phycisphaerae bacterium]|nr:PEP-CTERM sorting domain-containing protein [Phycisphaerae bacterium]
MRQTQTAIGVCLAVVVVMCMPTATVQAWVYDWNNASGGSMNNVANWTPAPPGGAAVPGAGDDAIFNITLTGPVTGVLPPSRVMVGEAWRGMPANPTAVVDLSGSGTSITLPEWGYLYVGHDDVSLDGDTVSGDLTISNSAIVSGEAFGSIGWRDGATGIVTVDEATLILGKQIDVGRDGGSGTVNVLNGASLSGGAMYIGNGADADDGSMGVAGFGDLTVDASSSLLLSGWDYVPEARLAIGLRGGTGSARIDGTAAVGDIYVAWDNNLGNATGLLAVGVGADIDGTLLDLGDAATLTFDLGSLGASGDLDIAGGLSLDGVLDLDLLDGQTLGSDYILATGTVSGIFSSVYYEGSLVSNPTDWGAIGGTHRLKYYNDHVALIVPEPTTMAIFGMGVLLTLVRRRSR